MDIKIKASLFSLAAQEFETEKDKEEYKRFSLELLRFGKIIITPLYSKEGRLMSFIIDSQEAGVILNEMGFKV